MSYNFDHAPGYENFNFSNLSKEIQDEIAKNPTSIYLSTPISSFGSSEGEIAQFALTQIKSLKVDYGDLRFGLDTTRNLNLSDLNITNHSRQDSIGIGIRILFQGFWGFASTSLLSENGIKSCVDQAYLMAKAVAQSTPKELGTPYTKFAKESSHQSEFHTPIGICPFTEDVSEIANRFQSSARKAMGSPHIKRVYSFLYVKGFRRIFANTEGSYILTTHSIVEASQKLIAVNDGQSAYRTLIAPGTAGGMEHFYNADFASQAQKAAQEASDKCAAKSPEPGEYDLILDGHHLALTMHESVGHPTELDRVLGYEFGFAGGSFASLDKLNKFQYGSSIVNFTANNRVKFGVASRGYDDEGVECQNTPIIRDGILVGYGTNRETAHNIGLNRSNGNCRSNTWADAPIVRIPNLFLEPGSSTLSREDLIKDTKNGILMLGRDSFSIDQMRYNFQFGADMCYRIKNGKIVEPLNNVIYQSISPEFWNSCDAICDSSEWEMHGVINCGKGQPIQSAQMMHGAAPSRFKNITVGY